MKNKSVIISILIILTAIIALSFYTIHKKDSDQTTNINSSQLISIYNTNQYQVYKQFTYLISNSEPELIEYQEDISIDDLIYHQYTSGNVTVNVLSRDNDIETNDGIYTIIYQNETYSFNEDTIPRPGFVRIYYVDINNDCKKDVVFIGDSYSGTNVCYYWIHAIDLTEMNEIALFSSEEKYISDAQEQQLTDLLSDDEEFQSTFSDSEGMNYSFVPEVDKYGNVYCRLGLGKGIVEGIGNILVLFDYNKDTKLFDVVDYLYIPHYVTECVSEITYD